MNLIKDMQRMFNENNAVWYMALFSSLVLSLPALLRYYTYKRHIIYGLNTYEQLSYYISQFGSGKASLLIAVSFPIVLGIISVFLCYNILSLINIKGTQKTVIIIFLILSPLFIYTFTLFSVLSLTVCLLLLSVYLFIQKNTFFRYGAIVPLLLVLLLEFNTMNADFFNLNKINFLQNNLTDLGALMGFGIFSLVLMVVGLYYSLRERKKSYGMYILLFIFVLLSAFDNKYRAYLNFIIIFFSGYGFVSLQDRTWDIKILKHSCLFLFLLGILFSGLSFIDRVQDMEPGSAVFENLEWLNSQNLEGMILSDRNLGNVINHVLGEEKAFTAVKKYNQNENNALSKQRYNEKIAEALFYSRDIQYSSALFEQHNITVIIITDDMESGGVWTKDNEGLLFLLNNSEKFKRLRVDREIEIWQVVK